MLIKVPPTTPASNSVLNSRDAKTWDFDLPPLMRNASKPPHTHLAMRFPDIPTNLPTPQIPTTHHSPRKVKKDTFFVPLATRKRMYSVFTL
jgi:hypothetical protein